MRPTNQIDDPTWDDITDRDKLIRTLARIIEVECGKGTRPNMVLILDSCDYALESIGQLPESPSDIGEDIAVLFEGYAGTLS